MDLIFDAKSTGSSDPSSNTLTWSHTCTGSNRLLVVTVGESRNVTINSITYAGVGLTEAISITNGNSRAYIYYLINPDSGANDIIVTYSAAITVPRAGGVSFTNADQSDVLGATNTKTGTAQNKTIDLTTTANGSGLVECIGALGGIHTPTSGQTVINTDGNNRIGGYEIVGGAGVYTQTWDSDASADYSYVIAEFKAIPSNKFLQLLGVGI